MPQTIAKKAAKKAAAKRTPGRALASVRATDDVLDLDAVGAEGTPFPFTIGGKRYEVCDLNDLPIEVVEAADSGGVQAIREAIKFGFGADDPTNSEAMDNWTSFSLNRLSIRQATALFLNWLSHSGLKQGE